MVWILLVKGPLMDFAFTWMLLWNWIVHIQTAKMSIGWCCNSSMFVLGVGNTSARGQFYVDMKVYSISILKGCFNRCHDPPI